MFLTAVRRKSCSNLPKLCVSPRLFHAFRGSPIGKYQKVDKSGNPVLTIGDPILDLVFDDEARVFIGGEAIHLTTTEFSSARYRSGGIRSIDLSGVSSALAQSQLLAAARGEGDFALVESSDRVLSFAATNPSQRDFYQHPEGTSALRHGRRAIPFTGRWGPKSRRGEATSHRQLSKASILIRSSPKLRSRSPLPVLIIGTNKSSDYADGR